jgi:HK97 family phage portal protein
MTWWRRWLERRAQTWRVSQLQSWGDMGIGPWPTAAGAIVSPETALSVPAVFSCVNVLAADLAKTPIKLRRKIGPDTFEDAREHDLWEILHDLPNPETTAHEFKRSLMFDLLAHERAFAEVTRTDGRVTALWRIDPTRVTVDRDEQRRKRWRVTLANGSTQTWTFDPSRPPVFELSVPSPIRHCRELIGTALALQGYVGKFFSNGARLGGVLQTDGVLSEESIRNLRESWDSKNAGVYNAHRTDILEQGLKYTPIAAVNSDAQLNETLQTIRTEICGAFRVPTWKVGDLTKATYSNMEAGAIEYVSGALDPYFSLWEDAIRRDLLTTRQFGSFDILFDRSTLIRSDVRSLHDALARGRDAGYYSVNDVRRKLGENPIGPEGDVYAANANLQPLTAIAEGTEP